MLDVDCAGWRQQIIIPDPARTSRSGNRKGVDHSIASLFYNLSRSKSQGVATLCNSLGQTTVRLEVKKGR